MGKYFYLSTIQSTGTWWAVDALRNHPDVGGIAHIQNLMYLNNNWAFQGGWADNPHNESLAPDGQMTMLYSHYGGTPKVFDPRRPGNNYEWVMLVVPTLAPLRDPLLCMIRAWHREASLYPHGFLMNGWMFVAKRGNTLGVRFWRMEPFDKEGFLDAVQSVELSLPKTWVNNLDPSKRFNDTPGECDMRQDYANGDWKALNKKLPIPCRWLQENEPVLRPFLEPYGFKDLLWWS